MNIHTFLGLNQAKITTKSSRENFRKNDPRWKTKTFTLDSIPDASVLTSVQN